MSGDVESSSPSAQRTRRNAIKIGALLASAIAARAAYATPKKQPDSSPLNPDPNCFLKGTKIRTCEGERRVEELAIGNFLPTMFSGNRQIQWIGRHSFKKSDPAKGWVKDAMPIRIARSALAPGVPHADLYVTWRHSVWLDGVLAPAELLVNGATITRFEASEHEELEYFHIKLESHNVIYAEGAPVETLLNVNESAANFAEYYRRYGMPRTDEEPCAPRVPVGGFAELKSRLRSAASPWLDRRDPLDVFRDRLEEQGATVR
jgi:hypothetical protein